MNIRTWAEVLAVLVLLAGCLQAATFNVKDYGTSGDGKTLDSPAINRAIDAAAAAGVGTVLFPAGTYVSSSIRLKSHITLHLDGRAVLEASADGIAYDAPEANESTKYQDFGHSHWHNSLIRGERLDSVAITGSGLVHGEGLSSGERQQGGNKTIAL